MVVSLAFVGLFFYTVDLGGMINVLAEAKYQYVAPAILIYFAALLFRALRWQYLLSHVSRVGLFRLFPVVAVGYMANNLLPVRLGEVARSYYLRHREGVSATTGLATIVVERVYDGLTLLLLGAVAIPVLILSGLVDDAGTAAVISWTIFGAVAAAVFLFVVTLLTLLAVNPGFGSFLLRLANRLPVKIRPKAQSLIALFIQGLEVLRKPRRHLGLLLLSLPIWFLEGAMYLVIAFSFDLPGFFNPPILVLPVILLVVAASNLATSIPSSPGSIGAFEVPAVAALVLVGVGDGVAGAFAVLVHFTSILPVTLLGLFYLWLESVPLTRLLRRDETASPRPPAVTPGVLAGGQEKR